MKKTSLVIAFILMFNVSTQANAQNSATSSANASVTLITPISIANTSDLNFGTFVPSESPGTITMNPDGVVSAAGGVTVINGGETSAAAFNVTGETGQSYALTLPSNEVTLNCFLERGDNLILNDFTSNLSNGVGVIGTDETISVGGTLTVPAETEAGTYTGSFDVTVNYN